MFNTLRAYARYILTGDDTGITIMIDGEDKMPFIKENNGRFELFGMDGDFIQSYARRRDAVRGGERRGLKVA